jgi:hypothetical protein
MEIVTTIVWIPTNILKSRKPKRLLLDTMKAKACPVKTRKGPVETLKMEKVNAQSYVKS